MKQIIIDGNIVDRETETGILLEDIENSINLTINIIYAPTAIGKSSVTKKLSFELKSKNINCVLVKTSPVNVYLNSCFSYLNFIFNSLCEEFSNTEYSFAHFIYENYKNPKSDLADVLKNSDNEKSFLFKLAGKFVESIDYDVEKLKFNDKDKLYLQQGYVRYLLSQKRIILIIDNLQNIDNESLEFLMRTLNFYRNKNHYLIFEYTLSKDNNIEKLMCIAEFLKSGNITVKCTEIQKTDSRYIVDLIDKCLVNKPADPDFNVKLIQHYSNKNTGNIRELIDYSINYENAEDRDGDATYKILNTLDKSSLFILFVLFRFKGKISTDSLKFICECKKDGINYDTSIDNLKIYDLIRCKDKFIEVSHASILDSLKKLETKNPIGILATSNIKYAIEARLNNNPSDIIKDNFLTTLLEIYKETDALAISKLFKEIENNILTHLNIREAWQYISEFLSVIKPQIEMWMSLCIDILKLCFKFELYQECYKNCLKELEKKIDFNTKPILLIYKMMYLSALDLHNANIECYKENEQKNFSLQIKLNMKLIALSSYRSEGKISECIQLDRELKDKRFKSYIEYGYRYRLVDMYKKRDKAIRYLKKSVKFFKRSNNTIQEAKSLISYSAALAGLGKVKKATRNLNVASKLLKSQILGRHMLQVNLAVFQMLSGNFDMSVYSLLDYAETTAIVPFDRLAITVNKLVWCYENKRFDMVKMLENNVVSLINKEPDKHIHCLAYYDLHLLYKDMKELDKADFYYNKARGLMNFCNPVKARLSNKPTKETKFILSKPWHICYLVYWTYDILMN